MGNSFVEGPTADDGGIYYFIPKIVVLLNLSLHRSIQAFFGSIVLMSTILGLIACFRLFQGWLPRLIAVTGLAVLGFLSVTIGDVYIVLEGLPVAVIPWFLLLARRQTPGFALQIFVFLSGVAIGAANFVRAFSGVGVLLFLVIGLASFVRANRAQRFVLAGLLIAGVLLPTMYFRHLVSQRNAFMASHQVDDLVGRHTFWPILYMGLGFLNNKYGIHYLDESQADKVWSVAPGTKPFSDRWSAILKDEVIRICKTDPVFVIRTVFAKLGVVALYVILFANVGLVAAARYHKGWPLELAFWAAMGFNSLYGILTVPFPNYLLGLLTFAVLYSVLSVNDALNGGALQRPTRTA
jgi:hypothetical protein